MRCNTPAATAAVAQAATSEWAQQEPSMRLPSQFVSIMIK